jgi:hypothetical protein
MFHLCCSDDLKRKNIAMMFPVTPSVNVTAEGTGEGFGRSDFTVALVNIKYEIVELPFNVME